MATDTAPDSFGQSFLDLNPFYPWCVASIWRLVRATSCICTCSCPCPHRIAKLYISTSPTRQPVVPQALEQVLWTHRTYKQERKGVKANIRAAKICAGAVQGVSVITDAVRRS